MDKLINEDGILLATNQFRTDGQVPALSDSFKTFRFQVFKVDFEDGESWAIRVPTVSPSFPGLIVYLIEAEARALTELKGKGFKWAPRLKGCDLTFENPIGHPFIATTWIPGTQLVWTDDSPSRSIRDKVLEQLATIQAELIECTQENRPTTATEHYTKVIQNKIVRIRDGKLPELTEQDVSDQQSLLPTFLIPDLDEYSWAIDHGELVGEKILVNSEHDIIGITDWDLATKMPLQQAATFPQLLRLQDLAVPPSATIKKDQETYLASILGQDTNAAKSMAIVRNAKDADFHAFFLDSIISKSQHRELASHKWEKAVAFQKDQ
ncbi:hypothetical protein N7504_007616 [Penicillium tannophilum]|nr:hypothetical protein N7504_007616 [Penicillium tannophilum]